ncbi:unnamed protein product, partial [Diamesa serratosioi]
MDLFFFLLYFQHTLALFYVAFFHVIFVFFFLFLFYFYNFYSTYFFTLKIHNLCCIMFMFMIKEILSSCLFFII